MAIESAALQLAPPVSERAGAASLVAPPSIEIVVPVYNEEHDLGPSVHRLLTLPGRRVPVHLPGHDRRQRQHRRHLADRPRAGRAAPRRPGRPARPRRAGGGRSAHVWSASDAAVLAYMDVDLSTDLDGAAAARRAAAVGPQRRRDRHPARPQVARRARPKREVISRGYNALLHAVLGTRFSDAQCGFKAIRADRARTLLPLVEDTGWFFDTELLVLAERTGLRIHEVPVDWVDDPDSRVDIVATAMADLEASPGSAAVSPRARSRWPRCARTWRCARRSSRRRASPARCCASRRSEWSAPSRTSCSTSCSAQWCRRRRRMPCAAPDSGRQHRREPPLHLRGPRQRTSTHPSAPGPGRLRPSRWRSPPVRSPRCTRPSRARAARSRSRCSSPRTSPPPSCASSCSARGSSAPAEPTHRPPHPNPQPIPHPLSHEEHPMTARPTSSPSRSPARRADPATPLRPRGPHRSRAARLLRGRREDPAWVRPALLALLAATGVLYLWGLGASGWANCFYSAAVQAGSASWKAFFFGSFDAVEPHHRRQAAGLAVGDGALGPHVRRQLVEHPRAAGARGRRLRRRCCTLTVRRWFGAGRRAARRRRPRADAGRGADVPLQQPGRAAGAAARRRRLRDAAGRRGRQHPLARRSPAR